MVSKKKYNQLNNQALGLAFAVVGLLGWITGLFWHGLMGQPTMMGMMYRNFSFMNPVHSAIILLIFVAGGYIIGEFAARFYNWFLIRKG